MSETTDITMPTLVAVTALPGAIFFRVNCGKFLTLDGRRVISSTSIDGVADIMGTFRGYSVAIETKTKRGALRKTQITFRDRHTQAGGIYVVARSPSEAIAALQSLSPRENNNGIPNDNSSNPELPMPLDDFGKP
jgi:hypothetical protein